jgi:hypothetical protein
MALLLTLCAPASRSAEIAGRILLKGSVAGSIRAGYVGVTASGETVSCMAGTSLGRARASVWCDTYKPRRSKIDWDPDKGCAFAHTVLPPGTYVVYAQLGTGTPTGRW